MAISEISGVKHYVCDSEDTKPTSGIPSGSTLMEFTDGEPPTVRKFIFDGTAWGLVVTTIAESESE